MSDRYSVRFPGGYQLSVFAADAVEAKHKALEELLRRGYSVNPKLNILNDKVEAVVV